MSDSSGILDSPEGTNGTNGSGSNGSKPNESKRKARGRPKGSKPKDENRPSLTELRNDLRFQITKSLEWLEAEKKQFPDMQKSEVHSVYKNTLEDAVLHKQIKVVCYHPDGMEAINGFTAGVNSVGNLLNQKTHATHKLNAYAFTGGLGGITKEQRDQLLEESCGVHDCGVQLENLRQDFRIAMRRLLSITWPPPGVQTRGNGSGDIDNSPVNEGDELKKLVTDGAVAILSEVLEDKSLLAELEVNPGRINAELKQRIHEMTLDAEATVASAMEVKTATPWSRVPAQLKALKAGEIQTFYIDKQYESKTRRVADEELNFDVRIAGLHGSVRTKVVSLQTYDAIAGLIRKREIISANDIAIRLSLKTSTVASDATIEEVKMRLKKVGLKLSVAGDVDNPTYKVSKP